MKKTKNLKKCMALVLAMMMLIGSNPVDAFAAKSCDISWKTDESYMPMGVWMYVDYCVEAGGIASHSESFLNSVYDFTGTISTAEDVIIIDVGAENHYFWGELSGILSVSGSTVGKMSASIGITGDEGQASASGSVENKSASVPFTCKRNAETTFSTSVSAIGFLACDLMLSYYANCYDEDTNRKVDYLSDNKTCDLHEKLDY